MNIAQEIYEIFQAHENIENSIAMSKYMKNKFVFFGIKTPLRRELSAPILTQSKKWEHALLMVTVQMLWTFPERECRYIAVDLLQKNKNTLKIEDTDTIQHFIQTDSWWDTVDVLAAHIIGTLVMKHASQRLMDDWIQSTDLWLRRTAILHQLTYNDTTDSERLFDYCLRCAPEKEFFIQKAIGWSLRQYAKTNPHDVKDFVTQNRNTLSKLSVREASKHFTK